MLLIGDMMPEQTRYNIDVVVCHTLIIRRVYVANMNQSIAHLIFSAVDEGIDSAIHGLVSHYMYVYGQTLIISLAC